MARKLGNGYSLALKTSENTHLTLIYFNSCKRGYEQKLVKSIAENYFSTLPYDKVVVEYGKLCFDRSIIVSGKEIEDLAQELRERLSSFKISEKTQRLHIDLRGNNINDLINPIPLFNNWYI